MRCWPLIIYHPSTLGRHLHTFPRKFFGSRQPRPRVQILSFQHRTLYKQPDPYKSFHQPPQWCITNSHREASALHASQLANKEVCDVSPSWVLSFKWVVVWCMRKGLWDGKCLTAKIVRSELAGGRLPFFQSVRLWWEERQGTGGKDFIVRTMGIVKSSGSIQGWTVKFYWFRLAR